jgi:hypothetical protein
LVSHAIHSRSLCPILYLRHPLYCYSTISQPHPRSRQQKQHMQESMFSRYPPFLHPHTLSVLTLQMDRACYSNVSAVRLGRRRSDHSRGRYRTIVQISLHACVCETSVFVVWLGRRRSDRRRSRYRTSVLQPAAYSSVYGLL